MNNPPEVTPNPHHQGCGCLFCREYRRDAQDAWNMVHEIGHIGDVFAGRMSLIQKSNRKKKIIVPTESEFIDINKAHWDSL